jgi:solute carrier family 25 (mitochondrial carnitine/acylcarnitine transporter), member 20/29
MVKVQLQSRAGAPGATAMGVARDIVRRQGVRGLYRGMTAPLLGVSPIFALNFWAYAAGKDALVRLGRAPTERELSLRDIGLAGALAAVPTTAIMAPGERIKILLQTQTQTSTAAAAPFKGPGDVVRHVLRTEGAGGLFRGASATLLRDATGSFAYFAVYEGLKRRLTPAGSSTTTLSPLAVVLAGGCAGVANWLLAIPIDTVKTVVQMRASSGSGSGSGGGGGGGGFLATATRLVREEGVASLYKGVGPALLRAFPANAACFLGMELSRTAMDTLF